MIWTEHCLVSEWIEEKKHKQTTTAPSDWIYIYEMLHFNWHFNFEHSIKIITCNFGFECMAEEHATYGPNSRLKRLIHLFEAVLPFSPDTLRMVSTVNCMLFCDI